MYNLQIYPLMSLITDFKAILGAHQTIKSARKDEDEYNPYYYEHFSELNEYHNFDVNEVYDEETEDIIEEEWD